MALKGKRIVVCVTGSVAAIETPKLVRELRRRGAKVYCAMSKSAKQIIHPDVLEWASENKVVTKITGKVEHVKLAGQVPNKADLVVVAPCTANTIGKIAAGIDDTPVTTIVTTAFGSKIPIMVVPSMHISMYRHPIVVQNISKLESFNVVVAKPNIAENKAKFPAIKELAELIDSALAKKDLMGKRILVTAGGTAEDIDDVRFIANRSSGKMGIHIAEQAQARGAKVTLVRGLTSIEPSPAIKDVKVRSAGEMLQAVKKNVKADIIIHAAAVSDYTVKKKSGKIASGKEFSLKLTPTEKILEKIKRLNPNVFLVGFKAECNVSKKTLVERAFSKLKDAKADLVVANDACGKGIGIGSEKNEVYVVNAGGKSIHFGPSHKREIANRILDMVK